MYTPPFGFLSPELISRANMILFRTTGVSYQNTCSCTISRHTCYTHALQRTKKIDRIDGKFGGPKKRITRDWSTAPSSRLKNVRKRRAVPPAQQVRRELSEWLYLNTLRTLKRNIVVGSIHRVVCHMFIILVRPEARHRSLFNMNATRNGFDLVSYLLSWRRIKQARRWARSNSGEDRVCLPMTAEEGWAMVWRRRRLTPSACDALLPCFAPDEPPFLAQIFFLEVSRYPTSKAEERDRRRALFSARAYWHKLMA